MSRIILWLITLLHILFILFVVIIPFTNSNYLLLLHAVTVPFMMFHWIINDNTCALTLAEHYVRKKLYGTKSKKEETFMAGLIEPIYDFKENHKNFSDIIYVITIILWLISTSKLYFKYRSGEISSFHDLMKI